MRLAVCLLVGLIALPLIAGCGPPFPARAAGQGAAGV
jgi:hypothetical protein